MSSWATIEAGLASWIATVSGVTAIWAHQTKPRPSLPYIVLQRTTILPIGTDAEKVVAYNPTGSPGSTSPTVVVGTELKTTYYRHVEATIRVQAIGTGALNYVSLVRDAFELDSARDDLAVLGIVRVSCGALQNITELVATQYQERGSLDMTVRLSESSSQVSTWIETVEVTPVTNPAQVVVDGELEYVGDIWPTFDAPS